MGWVIGIVCVLAIVAFIWLVVYWFNRDIWDDLCGLGDFIDLEESEEETKSIDEGDSK